MPSESIFAKFITDLEKEPTEVDPAIKLLEWLTYHWTKPTVTVRNICQFGPRPNRDLESVLGLTEILVQRGKLIPIKTPRHDSREWHVVRGPIKS